VRLTQDTVTPAGNPAGVRDVLVPVSVLRLGADHVRQLTVLGDSVPWLWNIASSKFPEATQIVDLYQHRPRPDRDVDPVLDLV
jgi:hypothetical protein